MPEDAVVSNVHDTARWIAAHRAMETMREDALFRDPWAGTFARDAGFEMARRAHAQAGPSVVVRTKLMDEMVLDETRRGADTVLDLAAGFDTRPYRLALPPTLRWIEADVDAILREKSRVLANASPSCLVERHAVDLSRREERDAFLGEALAGSRRALVLTEGLLVYLAAQDVAALSDALLAQPAVRAWALDLMSPFILRANMRRMSADLANAPLRFAPEDGVAFFERLGWRVAETHDAVRESVRMKRAPWWVRPFALAPRADPRKVRRAPWYGIVKLERAP